MTAPPITLKKRAEFLRVRGGRRAATPACVVEMRPRAPDGEAGPPRFGFTVTRQLGGAVIRNRARRRLKAAVAGCSEQHARAGCDYVLIAREAMLAMPFAELCRHVRQALAKVDRFTPREGESPEKPKPA